MMQDETEKTDSTSTSLASPLKKSKHSDEKKIITPLKNHLLQG